MTDETIPSVAVAVASLEDSDATAGALAAEREPCAPEAAACGGNTMLQSVRK